MLKAIFLLFLTASFYPSTRAEAAYNLADLEALSEDGSYEEFFKHALDVRPSERQGPWKTMVTRMADVFTRSILNKEDVEKKNFLKIEEIYRWPVLRADDVFRSRRNELGIRYLSACLKSSTPCWGDFKNFWESDPRDPEVAFKLSELGLKFKDSPIDTWVFLNVALKSSLSEFYCQKDHVMTALWNKLDEEYIKLGMNGDLLTKIDRTVHPDCLPHLNIEARKKLFRPDKTSDRELGYQILKSQGKANQKMADVFLVVYLLEKPSQGELFNIAWNRLKQLGASSLRRDEVMKALKDLDPLPDDILASLDEAKKRVVLNHFKQNFPEYIDHYSNQCLAFYGGKTNFPRGNPTIHCQDLMSSELGRQLISTDKLERFREARKI